ncbi:sensor histidine kinase [Streptomyces sp. NPDC003753]|uniref:sensor histidine kinase n=1 Tax=unclassified Streptomyces TaxID=2593676 RepID=UPI001F3E0B1D|nr:sensor histidine kinase [Streptomyces sp. Y2F8-2]
MNRVGIRNALPAVSVATLTLVFAAGGIGPSGGDDRPVDAGAVALAVGCAVALGLRTRLPFTALLAADGITLGWLAAGYPGRLITLSALITCYTVTARRGWRWGVAGALVCLATTSVVTKVWLTGSWFDDRSFNGAALIVASFALGAAIHYHRAFAAGARAHAEQVAQARAEQARREVAEERLRIARELHDVFGHTMAAISVQAGVAVHVMERRPAQAAEALTAIKRISDEGLDEVRTLLGALRGVPSPAAPESVGLARADRLLETLKSTGVHTELTVRGAVRPLPAATDLTAYRVLQESLTNIRRHAHATAVRVAVDYGPSRLDLTVTDNGRGGTPDGRGSGIEGMAARADALGGSLSAGPQPGGGFAVRCSLPLVPPEEAS